MDSVVSAPFRYLESLNEDIHDLLILILKIKIEEKVAELENQSEVIDSLKSENDQLNSAINASSSINTQFSAIGKVIVRSPVSWYDSLTVKLGKIIMLRKRCLLCQMKDLLVLSLTFLQLLQVLHFSKWF